MPTLSSEQKRKARQKIATRRGVPASSVSDSDITSALNSGLISMSDCGTSYGGYDSGGSYDSGSSSSDCGGGGD